MLSGRKVNGERYVQRREKLGIVKIEMSELFFQRASFSVQRAVFHF